MCEFDGERGRERRADGVPGTQVPIGLAVPDASRTTKGLKCGATNRNVETGAVCGLHDSANVVARTRRRVVECVS